jgi:hypothetical protein
MRSWLRTWLGSAIAYSLAFTALCLLVQVVSGGYQSDRGQTNDEAAHFVSSLMIFDYVFGHLGENPMSFAKNYYAHFPHVLIWITSYAGIRYAPGIPLYDLMQAGKRGDDRRMYFSWYGGDFTTDADAAELPPEQRANPSMASWGNDGYLDQQRQRLPVHKFRRLHLNLPGAPDGAAFSGEHVMAAIVTGRKQLLREPGVRHFGFVDMSGGSSDDAVLGIAHYDVVRRVRVLDQLVAQTGTAPFNPRHAVKKFAAVLKEYGVTQVSGDAYAGETFRGDFQEAGIAYLPCGVPKSDLYEQLEPMLNAGEVELLDVPTMQEQLLTLVWRGSKIDHQAGDHDDYANAAAGAIVLIQSRQPLRISSEAMARFGAAA